MALFIEKLLRKEDIHANSYRDQTFLSDINLLIFPLFYELSLFFLFFIFYFYSSYVFIPLLHFIAPIVSQHDLHFKIITLFESFFLTFESCDETIKE